MTIINLTPHAVNVHLPSGEVRNFPVGGPAPRCAVTRTESDPVDGIPVVTSKMGAVEGLPPEEPGTWLIVSALVAEAAVGRSDLVCPGEAVRAGDGVIVGCRGLSRPVPR